MTPSTARAVHARPIKPESPLRTALKRLKFRLLVRFKPRKNRVYTQFFRFPNQYKALEDKVLPRLRSPDAGPTAAPLDIIMFGCSTGAEAFSLASFLRDRFGALRFRIRAFDIVPEVIEQARRAIFSRDEVYQGPFVSEDLVAKTFEPIDTGFRVRPEIVETVTFATGNILDENLIRQLGQADLVFAQNMLFHLPPPKAREAFNRLVELLAPKSALFINGMDTDMRVALTKRHNLEPLDYLVEEIHEDARVNLGSSWASTYWGREPFSRKSKDWLRQFCTIYFRSSS